MADELTRSAELIERLLGDPQLRRRFRADPGAVLTESGLPGLATGLGHGPKALMTLELRESRSSLAGVMVAAAAEAVDLAQLAGHAAPALAHEVDQLVSPPAHHSAPAHPAAPATPAGATAAPAASGTPAAATAAAHAGTTALAPSSGPAPHPAASPPGTNAPSAPPQAAQVAPTPSASATHTAAAPSTGAKLVVGRTADSTGPSAPAAPASASSPGGPAPATAAEHPHTPHHHTGTTDPAPAAAEPAPADPLLAYPGDSASPQQLAGWMAAHAQRAGLPPELPLMAALTESGLRNLNYGDRDSVGFFQMRLGIWNEGAYLGYPDHPNLQIQWFIDHALAVRAENPALAASPSSWGEWVADVEQPAAQYRYRYQLQLGAAQALLHGAELSPSTGEVAPIPVGQSAVDAAMHLVGRSRGASLQTGPSAAALVQYAYARQDIQLPAVASQQFDVGVSVSRDALKPGDAVFFADPDGVIRHVGLYSGRGDFITASPSGGGVHVARLSAPGFDATFAGARRFTAQTLSGPASYARPLPTITP